jgi:uncharacterized Zn-binding protein involved in type VI secretion
LKIYLSALKISSLYFKYLLVFTASILISSNNLSFSQYPERIEELTKKLEVLNKQLEACGTDLGCFQSKMAQIQQLSKEVQSLRKDLNKNPQKLAEDFASDLPKENEFPPPFDVITKPWIEHTMALSTVLKLDCNYITKSREEVDDWLDEIYKKGKRLNGPGWALLLAKCEETTVKLKEHGTINEPDFMYLDYNLQFVDRVTWVAKYYLIVGGRHMKLHDKLSYALGLADQNERHAVVLSYRGWIMDQSKNPPVKLPFTSYEILEEELVTFLGTQVPSYKGYTMIFPGIIEDPKDKYRVGKVSEYKLILPYQIVRFYTAKPDEYIETTVDFMVDTFTPEEIHGFFEQGNFKKSYSSSGVTQEIEIGSLSLDCDEQLSSDKGAIVLAGDCIDHGGYVIASDKVTTTVNGKPVAKIGDKVLCFKHGKTEIIASSNSNVLSDKKQLARIGDKTKCGAKIIGGSMDTFAGDK